MMKISFSLALLLFFGFFALGISANDAVNYVVNSNNFLYEGETYSPPNVAIEYGDSSYWVIPLISGNSIVTYFPLNAESGELSTSRSVNRGLFSVADSLRELQLLKSSISSNPGVDWIFTQKYQELFSEISVQAEDEVFQLNTVETTLKNEGVTVNLSSLKNRLSRMSSDSSSISDYIAVASSAENMFATTPSEESLSEMNDSFDYVFSSISSLNADFISYKSDLDKLKQEISLADIDAQTKSQLFAILEIPDGLQSIRNYNLDSTQISESLDSGFNASSLRADSVLDEFENRIVKNEVHAIIYGENEAIKKETSFLTLTEAKTVILSEDNISSWDLQSKVKSLEQNYARAVTFYNNRDFEQSKVFAEEAIDDAVSVYKKGKRTVVPQPLFSQELLFTVAGALVVLLVIVYLANHMLAGKEAEE